MKNRIISRIVDTISKNKLPTILVVGILVRIIMMPISAHPLDMYVWSEATSSIIKNGPMSIQFFPPTQGYFLSIPLAYFYNWITQIFSLGSYGPISMESIPSSLNFYPDIHATYVPGILFNFITKIPLLFSDIFSTILLYKIVFGLTRNEKSAQKAAIFWFLNPFLIWISAIWGMWDTLPVLFSLACFHFLLNKKILLASIFLAIGFFLKIYPILFLIPIGIYIVKSEAFKEKKIVLSKFFAVFLIATTLISIPFLDRISKFITDFIAINQAIFSSFSNPVSSPLAFGLTYWSLYSLNRFTKIPLNPNFSLFLSFSSILLVAISLILVYRKFVKINFRYPTYDLALGLLLPIIALFLSFRIICEQWLLWSFPFLIILVVGRKIKSSLFWGVSILGLLYVILNCPLPFFFLSLSPWIGNYLVEVANIILSIEQIRIGLLAAIGCIFSVMFILILSNLRRRTVN
jgi:Gpi18-like mannosyltransferase